MLESRPSQAVGLSRTTVTEDGRVITAEEWIENTFDKKVEEWGRRRQAARRKATLSSRGVCCTKPWLRILRTSLLFTWLLLSVGVVSLFVFVLRVEQFSSVHDRAVSLSYPCDGAHTALQTSGKEPLLQASFPTIQDTNISHELGGREYGITYFDFSAYTAHQLDPRRVVMMTSMPYRVNLQLLHLLSLGVLQIDLLRVRVLPMDACSEAAVWPNSVEAATFLYREARGSSFDLKGGNVHLAPVVPDMSSYLPPRSTIVQNETYECGVVSAWDARANPHRPLPPSGLNSTDGIELSAGAYMHCEAGEGDGTVVTEDGIDLAVWLFLSVDVILTLFIVVYLITNLSRVYRKWFAVYALRIAPEYHLVRVKVLEKEKDIFDDQEEEQAEELITRSMTSRRATGQTVSSNKKKESDRTFWLELLDGSHGSEEEGGRLPEDESVFSCGACAKVCPCFSCCCASCLRKEQRGRDRAAGLVTQDEVEAAARRRKVGEYFLHHFLADVICWPEMLDFFVSDPIQCDTKVDDALLSSVVHAVVGAAPHAPLCLALHLMGCGRSAYAVPGEDGPGSDCSNSHPLEYSIFGLIALQSLTYATYHSAWYHNAPLWLRRRLRHLSNFLWSAESLLALAYLVSGLLWLLLAILIDPLRAAVPVVYVASFFVYFSFAYSVLKRYGAFSSDSAHKSKELLIKAGVPVASILSNLIWGFVIMLMVVGWLLVGFALLNSLGNVDMSTGFWGQIASACAVFGVAVRQGLQRTAAIEEQLQGKVTDLSAAGKSAADGTGHLSLALDNLIKKVDDEQRTRVAEYGKMRAEIALAKDAPPLPSAGAATGQPAWGLAA